MEMEKLPGIAQANNLNTTWIQLKTRGKWQGGELWEVSRKILVNKAKVVT